MELGLGGRSRRVRSSPADNSSEHQMGATAGDPTAPPPRGQPQSPEGRRGAGRPDAAEDDRAARRPTSAPTRRYGGRGDSARERASTRPPRRRAEPPLSAVERSIRAPAGLQWGARIRSLGRGRRTYGPAQWGRTSQQFRRSGGGFPNNSSRSVRGKPRIYKGNLARSRQKLPTMQVVRGAA